MKSYRNVRLVGAVGSTLRTAEYNGTEHLVVPVVAMVEGVVWAVNSKHPELVTAQELSITPQQWNGRPCFAGHPEEEGTQVSGNTPRVLERSFGVIFDAAPSERILSEKRLELEAWLDPAKAEAIGPDAVDVITRIRAGKRVEVSVGCYVVCTKEEGNYNGKPFVGRWTGIVSDHLAFLPEGVEGACSIEAGCGAPRTAVRHFITAQGIAAEESMAVQSEKRSLKERLLGMLFRSSMGESMSDNDMRHEIGEALRASVPGFMGIEAVYPDESLVVFYAQPGDEFLIQRQSYSMGEDGKVALSGEAETVEPVTTYEPVKAAMSVVETPKVACGCKGAAAEVKETSMKETTKTFIANSKGKFTDADAAWIDAIPENQLQALQAVEAPAATVVAPVATVVEPVVPQSEEEFLQTAPESVKAIVADHKAAQVKAKTGLVNQLKTAQAEFSEVELNAMSVTELSRMARLVQVEPEADFSGRGVVRAAASSETDVYSNPPDGYALALAARKQ